MNILKKYRLKKQQKALMQKRKVYEYLQTEHSENEYFYHYTQKEMDVWLRLAGIARQKMFMKPIRSGVMITVMVAKIKVISLRNLKQKDCL